MEAWPVDKNWARDAAVMKGAYAPSLIEELASFAERGKFPVDAPSLLEKHLKDTSDQKILGRYRLVRRYGSGQDPFSGPNSPYLDFPYAVILYHKRNCILPSHPVALACMRPQNKALLIAQIQGVKGKRKALHPLKWTFALVDAWYCWAQANNIPEIRILPQEQNEWATVREYKGGFLLYDLTARRMGFTYNESILLYTKPVLPEIPTAPSSFAP